jgi:hypothetical protein
MEASAPSKAKEDTAGCIRARDVGTPATLVNVAQQIIKEEKKENGTLGRLGSLSGTGS